MKYILLCFFLVGAMAVNAQEKQSLKDLLYSGKLKKDSSGVVRSTDDLSTKIDTTTKKEPEAQAQKPEALKVTAPVADATKEAVPAKETANEQNVPVNPSVDRVQATVQNSSDAVETADTTAAVATPSVPAAAPKTNTKIWKEYTDALVKNLHENVLKSKQVKKESYFVTIEYEIGTEGQVNILNVTTMPSNAYLQAQVKQIVESNPPAYLNPAIDSAGVAKKVKRKQNFTVTKD